MNGNGLMQLTQNMNQYQLAKNNGNRKIRAIISRGMDEFVNILCWFKHVSIECHLHCFHSVRQDFAFSVFHDRFCSHLYTIFCNKTCSVTCETMILTC